MTARDSLDEFADALFSAARLERPRDDVRARALDAIAMPRDAARAEILPEDLPPELVPVPEDAMGWGARYGAALAFAAAVAAVAGGVVLFQGQGEPAMSIGPERSSRPAVPAVIPPAKGEPAPLPVAPAPPSEEPSPVRSASPRSLGRVPAAPSASLPDEIATLDRARTALTGGDTTGALRLLDQYDRVLRGTRLGAEATVLRIEALERSGKVMEASELAAKFVEANPGSALSDRARAFIRTGNGLGVDAGGTP